MAKHHTSIKIAIHYVKIEVDRKKFHLKSVFIALKLFHEIYYLNY